MIARTQCGVGGKFEMADPGGTGSDRIRRIRPDPTGSTGSDRIRVFSEKNTLLNSKFFLAFWGILSISYSSVLLLSWMSSLLLISCCEFRIQFRYESNAGQWLVLLVAVLLLMWKQSKVPTHASWFTQVKHELYSGRQHIILSVKSVTPVEAW